MKLGTFCPLRRQSAMDRDRSGAEGVRDEAELYGLLRRLRNVGASLVSVSLDP